jgi:hypothetical protein
MQSLGARDNDALTFCKRSWKFMFSFFAEEVGLNLKVVQGSNRLISSGNGYILLLIGLGY